MIRLRRLEVRDPAAQGLVGATILVPEGSRFEGGFHWMPTLSMQAMFLGRVADPTSGAEARWLPGQQFAWPLQNLGLPLTVGSNWNGSVLRPPPRDPVDFCLGVLAHVTHPELTQARVVAVEDRPQVAAETARRAPPQMTVRSSRVRFAGPGWDEDVHLTLTFSPPDGWSVLWWCGGHSVRAPSGRLDELAPLLTATVRSLTLTPDWLAHLELARKLNAAGRRHEIAATQQFGEQLAAYRREAAARQEQVWADRLASQERQRTGMREILGGVETYRDPFEGRPVELPVGYAAVWATRDGYVLSNDPSFDPRAGSTEDYRRVPSVSDPRS